MTQPEWKPDVEFFQQALGFRVGNYGMATLGRPLHLPANSSMLTTLAPTWWREAMRAGRQDDAVAERLGVNCQPLRDGGTGANAYAEAVTVYLGFALSKQADLGNSLCAWEPVAQCPRHLFGRQAIPMVWDFAEGNPLGDSSGAWTVFVDGIVKAFSKAFETVQSSACGGSQQADAGAQCISCDRLISTDPPYYDNIGYADLSDFFYVWLRRSLRPVFPDLFSTLAVPKEGELVATPDRHGGKEKAETFFLNGMSQAMNCFASQAHPVFPVSIYYAFKQSESLGDAGTGSTGWETFLSAVIRTGFSVTGTWPMRTENSSRMRGMDSNALASSIVLVCRKRSQDAPLATRREFVVALRAELPAALAHLQSGNIAPVDLAQAAIGPGMAVYTRYAKVLDAQGNPVSVRDALALINHTLDEVLAEQEGEFDADTRWALAWFDQQGFTAGDYGVAETLSTAKNTSVAGMQEAGILESKAGEVRLLRPQELPEDWDPAADRRLPVWEVVHHLVRVLESDGETGTARLVRQLGGVAETARELAYRLYSVAERKSRSAEALSYNGLVQSWPEIARLARQEAPGRAGWPVPRRRAGSWNMSAIHGSWCNSVTWRTKCRSCKEQVFFFQCDCGSGVFFDKLGPPWPIHDCDTAWARNLKRWKDDSGGLNVEIGPGMTVRWPPEGPIDQGVVTRAVRRDRRPDPIEAIQPEGSEEVTVVGILRELQVEVGVAAFLKLPETSMASGFLGKLAQGRWGKVTIHSQSPRVDMLNSYTAWVPSPALSDAGNSKGVTVEARISSQFIPGVGNVWICSLFEMF